MGSSQLSCGLGDALRDLGEFQAGALHHAGLTAALVGTDHVTVAFTAQLVILRACREMGRLQLRGPGGPGSPRTPSCCPAPCPPLPPAPPGWPWFPPLSYLG